jgi:PilZ domain
MRDFGPDLERRQSLRHRPHAECEIFVGARAYPAAILDASRGGLFVSTEAPVWPTALVRVRFNGAERHALVVHQRHIPPRLRALLPGGIGLRWVRSTPSD